MDYENECSICMDCIDSSSTSIRCCGGKHIFCLPCWEDWIQSPLLRLLLFKTNYWHVVIDEIKPDSSDDEEIPGEGESSTSGAKKSKICCPCCRNIVSQEEFDLDAYVKTYKGEKEVTDSNDGVQYLFSWDHGLLHGPVIGWYPDGQIKSYIPYENGCIHGYCRTWYPDGTLHEEGNYTLDVRHGAHVSYYRNGNRDTYSMYFMGSTVGPLQSYFPDGTLSAEFVVVGPRSCQETSIKRYYQDGHISTEENTAYGVKHGPQRLWSSDPDHKLIDERIYHQGLLL